jgi:hypothetical protein
VYSKQQSALPLSHLVTLKVLGNTPVSLIVGGLLVIVFGFGFNC